MSSGAEVGLTLVTTKSAFLVETFCVAKARIEHKLKHEVAASIDASRSVDHHLGIGQDLLRPKVCSSINVCLKFRAITLVLVIERGTRRPYKWPVVTFN